MVRGCGVLLAGSSLREACEHLVPGSHAICLPLMLDSTPYSIQSEMEELSCNPLLCPYCSASLQLKVAFGLLLAGGSAEAAPAASTTEPRVYRSEVASLPASQQLADHFIPISSRSSVTTPSKEESVAGVAFQDQAKYPWA